VRHSEAFILRGSIGEIIDNVDDNTVLIIVSDHGGLKYQSEGNYTFANMRKEDGIIFIYSNGIGSGINLNVYYVAPTVMYLLELPYDTMLGKPIIVLKEV
jgi:bisphosphoglycerate-independent phosphoglycerate mutase (AlkP superfamily)